MVEVKRVAKWAAVVLALAALLAAIYFVAVPIINRDADYIKQYWSAR